MLDICVILAGGKSSRMGRDKSLLPFMGEENLAMYQSKKMSKIFDKVFFSSKNDKFNSKLNLILDEQDEFSPMLALISIFKYVRSNFLEFKKIFILAVDMPFIKQDSIEKMSHLSQNHKVCIAKDKNFNHNLCAFYDVSLLDKAIQLHNNNEHRISVLLSDIDVAYCLIDPDEARNLNYFYEYESAIKFF